MNLKPVELQMAIPRATEVGRVQQQLQQKPQQDQFLLQQSAVKQAEIMQQKTKNVDEAEKERVRDEKKEKEKENKKKQKKANAYQSNDQAKDSVEHPYKGRRVDLTL